MFRRLIASLVCLTFSFSNLQYVQAQDFNVNQLPVPGTMVDVSTPFAPLALKGLIVNPQKPLEFQFIVDTGKGPQDTASIKEEANQLVKYFLAGLTIPEGDLWVNLSPYEKNRMVPEALGQTDLGRDLLAQDYILKQLTASLIYPEKDLGKEFWSRVYAKAQQQFGTTNIPVNTFNKVWILPNQAQVYENGNAAYVTKSTLKVMLDEDYLALSRHSEGVRSTTEESKDVLRSFANAQDDKTHSLASQIVRAIILPEIEKEVNTGKNFALLRQIYQALILAKWYKATIQNGLLDALYTNKNKVAGVNLNDPTIKEQIYERYLKAYKKGAFNYIKADPTPDGQVVPRKYFSGGTNFAEYRIDKTYSNSAMLAKGWIAGALLLVAVGLGVTIYNKNSKVNPQGNTTIQNQGPSANSQFTHADGEKIIDELVRDIEQDHLSTTDILYVTKVFKGEGNYVLGRNTDFDERGTENIIEFTMNAVALKGKYFAGDKVNAFRSLANFPPTGGYRNKMVQLLSSSDPVVRIAAAINLRKMPSKDLILPLTKLLKDPNPDVRVAAVVALGSSQGEINVAAIDEPGADIEKLKRGIPQPYADDRVYSALEEYVKAGVREKDVPFILETLKNTWVFLHSNNFSKLLPQVHSNDQNMEEFLQYCYHLLESKIDLTSPEDKQPAIDVMVKAAAQGDIATVKYLSSHLDINSIESKMGVTSLFAASYTGQLNIVKFLIAQGANLNMKAKDGVTPLIIASQEGRNEVVDQLLAKGAEINAKTEDGATALIQASGNGHKEVVDMLLAKGADVNVRRNDGVTALMDASVNGNKDVMHLLITKGADVNAKRAGDGVTPLILASENGNKDAVEQLLGNGVDINAKANNGATALMMASQENHKDVVELLIERGADVDVKSNNGATALMGASMNGHKEVVELLLAKNANVNAKNGDGSTALMYASHEGFKEIVQLLLAKDADINAKDGQGWTPLMRATQQDQKEIVNLLLTKNIDINAKATNGSSALSIASTDGNKEIAAQLLIKGADVNTKMSDDWTVLMMASAEGNKDIVSLLFDHGAKVNLQAKDGATALMLAVTKGYPDMVEQLIAHGADVNARWSNGASILSIAQDEKNPEIIRILKTAGAKDQAMFGQRTMYKLVTGVLAATLLAGIVAKQASAQTNNTPQILSIQPQLSSAIKLTGIKFQELVGDLNDISLKVREDAISALGNSGDKRAIDPLYNYLTNRSHGDFTLYQEDLQALDNLGVNKKSLLKYYINGFNFTLLSNRTIEREWYLKKLLIFGNSDRQIAIKSIRRELNDYYSMDIDEGVYKDLKDLGADWWDRQSNFDRGAIKITGEVVIGVFGLFAALIAWEKLSEKRVGETDSAMSRVLQEQTPNKDAAMFSKYRANRILSTLTGLNHNEIQNLRDIFTTVVVTMSIHKHGTEFGTNYMETMVDETSEKEVFRGNRLKFSEIANTFYDHEMVGTPGQMGEKVDTSITYYIKSREDSNELLGYLRSLDPKTAVMNIRELIKKARAVQVLPQIPGQDAAMFDNFRIKFILSKYSGDDLKSELGKFFAKKGYKTLVRFSRYNNIFVRESAGVYLEKYKQNLLNLLIDPNISRKTAVKTAQAILAIGGFEHADILSKLLLEYRTTIDKEDHYQSSERGAGDFLKNGPYKGNLFGFLSDAIKFKNEGFDFNIFYQPATWSHEFTAERDFELRIERGDPLSKTDPAMIIPFTINWYIKRLESNESKVAISAGNALEKVGRSAIPSLVAAWQGEVRGSNARYNIAQALYRLGWLPQTVDERIEFYYKAKRFDELVKIGQSAVPFLLNKLNLLYLDRWDKERILKSLIELNDPRAIPAFVDVLSEYDRFNIGDIVSKGLIKFGKPAIPALVEAWQSDTENHSGISKVLHELGWSPQSIDKKILFYTATGQWKELVKIGAPAIPVLLDAGRWDEVVELGTSAIPALVERWRSINPATGLGHFFDHDNARKVINRADIARSLYKLGWMPESGEERMDFFVNLITWGTPSDQYSKFKMRWDGLVNIGALAIPALIKYREWDVLVKIGTPAAIQALAEALVEAKPGREYNDISDALHSLGDKRGKYHYKWIVDVPEESHVETPEGYWSGSGYYVQPNSETVIDVHEQGHLQLTDRAMQTSVQQVKANSSENGGIDLNQINVLRNGKTVNVQFDPAQLNQLIHEGFEGFTPVIINMTPISSPFQLLGIRSDKEEVLAKA